jgi:hypothetical protein
MGAIPEAESQQNADGLDASLDCRRSALTERRKIVARRTTSAQRPSPHRGASSRTRGSTPTPPRSVSHGSAYPNPVELETALADAATGDPLCAAAADVLRCRHSPRGPGDDRVYPQSGHFARIHETGIDIWSRLVYVRCTPEADGSNPESGRSAERRRIRGQTWFCRRSALSRSSRAGIAAPAVAGDPRFAYTRMIGTGHARPDVRQSRLTQ